MLHEILLSLWGCSTSVAEIIETDVIFIFCSKSFDNFNVNKFSFFIFNKLFQPLRLDNYLHPGERLLIEKILGIVRDCNTIRKFIRKNNSVDGM